MAAMFLTAAFALQGGPPGSSRRQVLALAGRTGARLTSLLLAREAARAAPPIAVIEEQLGYLPFVDGGGRTVYVPSRIFDSSTPQAVELAKHLKRVGATFYGAYWCPHCRNQRRLFGKEALQLVNYVECDPRGAGANAKLCQRAAVDGYPTWVIGDKRISGEHPLSELAAFSGFAGRFDQAVEPVAAAQPRGPCAPGGV